MKKNRSQIKRASCPADCKENECACGCGYLDAWTPCKNPEHMDDVDSSLEAELVAYARSVIEKQVEEAKR